MAIRQDGPTTYECDGCDAVAQSYQIPPSPPLEWIHVTEVGAHASMFFCGWGCLSGFAATERQLAEERMTAKAARTVQRPINEGTP